MSPQFVDFDGDGHLDVLTATFDGSPHLALGAEDGYSEPEILLDAAGERIALSHIWNYDDTEHQVSGRGMPGDDANGVRCISVLAYDWDRDGDHDLLLGSYAQGRLYRQMNEGSNAEPRFTGVNLAIEVGGQELSDLSKMTAPRLVDWDGDGDDDLLYGTFKNGDEAGGGV